MKIQEIIRKLEVGEGPAYHSREALIEILKDLDGYTELSHKDLTTTIETIKGLVKLQNPFRLITCTLTIGKSKEEVVYSFPVTDFLRIEDNLLILNSDERRLKLAPGQIACIDRQLSGETKI